jgi:hypothetical protein
MSYIKTLEGLTSKSNSCYIREKKLKRIFGLNELRGIVKLMILELRKELISLIPVQ